MIKAKVHYIPVKEDLSDLLDVIKWCKKNDDRCREIANNGLIFARSVLNKKFIQSYLSQIMWSLAPGGQKSHSFDAAIASAVPTSAPQPAIAMPVDASEYLELPADKKQCPKGYKSIQHEGQKKCKKMQKASKPPATKTKKVRFVDEGEYVDIPEGKKQCPKGYKAALHEGRKRCKKNVTKKSPPKLEIADDDTDEE